MNTESGLMAGAAGTMGGTGAATGALATAVCRAWVEAYGPDCARLWPAANNPSNPTNETKRKEWATGQRVKVSDIGLNQLSTF